MTGEVKPDRGCRHLLQRHASRSQPEDAERIARAVHAHCGALSLGQKIDLPLENGACEFLSSCNGGRSGG